MPLWGVEADSGVVGGVDGRVGWREHGCEISSGWGIPVGFEFVEEDLSVVGEFGGLRWGWGAWVRWEASSLSGYPAGRRGRWLRCGLGDGVVGWFELGKISVEGHDPSDHRSDVLFALPFRCPLDTTKL